MAWSPDYCTTTDLDHYISDGESGVGSSDAEMDFAISAASRAVDRFCNRQFGKDDVPTSRYFTARFDARARAWSVPIDDLMDSTGLAVAYDGAADFTFTTTVSGHRLTPLNAPVQGRPWTALTIAGSGVGASTGAVRVTGLFGWTDVPVPIIQATLMQASRFLARRNAPFGIAGSPDAGSEMRLLARLDPDVEVALAPYRRWWAAA